ADVALVVGPPPSRRRAPFLDGAGAPLVLVEDDRHGFLEHLARRAGGLSRHPVGELGGMHAEEGGQVLAAAANGLALLQDPRAHLGPARLLLHGGWHQRGFCGGGDMRGSMSLPPVGALLGGTVVPPVPAFCASRTHCSRRTPSRSWQRLSACSRV